MIATRNSWKYVYLHHNKKEYSFLTKTEAPRCKKNWSVTKNTIVLFSFDLQYVLQNLKIYFFRFFHNLHTEFLETCFKIEKHFQLIYLSSTTRKKPNFLVRRYTRLNLYTIVSLATLFASIVTKTCFLKARPTRKAWWSFESDEDWDIYN